MIDLLWFGAAFLIVFTGVMVGYKLTRKNKKKQQDAIITMSGDFIRVCWKGHMIVFNFIYVDGQLHYDGADCNEKYSCSLESTTKHKYPWKLWMKCGNDELTIITDLKSKYEII